MKRILKVLLILVIVGLFIGTLLFLWNKTQPKIIVYDLVECTRDTISNKTVATGNVEPRNEVFIKPQISGIISEICCEAGKMVKKGDILAHVKVIPEMGMLSSAESRVKITSIGFAQAQREYDRVNKLFNEGVIPVEEYEKSKTVLEQSKEELQGAKDNYEIIQRGMTSRSTESNTQIRATITGMVLDVPIKVGNSVILSNNFNDGTTIASIANLGDMIFVGDVDETEIGRIKEGMSATITIGALQEVQLEAKLEYISPKAVDKNGIKVFEIKASTEVPDSIFIRAGYSANASIITQIRENILVIPESVVLFEGDKSYVEVLTSSEEALPQIFERKDIVLGLSNGVIVEVISGLEGTEKIKGVVKHKNISNEK